MNRLRFFLIVILLGAGYILTADPPDWEVITGTEYSMVLIAQISLNGEEFSDLDSNLVAAFGPGGDEDCRSVAVWQEENPPVAGFWYFTIVGNQQDQGQEIFFSIYDSSSDQIFNCLESIIFQDNQTIGTPYDPFQLTVTAALGYITGSVEIDGEADPEDVVIQAGSVTANPDAEGSFSLILVPGVYQITAELEGYIADPLSYNGILVEDEQTVTGIDFSFEPEPVLGLALPGTAQGFPGMGLELPITLYNTDNIGIEGIGITVEFDDTFLTAIGAALTGGVLPETDYSLYTNLEEPGEISLTIVASGDLYTGDGDIVFLQFEVTSGAPVGQSCQVGFTSAQVNEQQAQTFDCLFTVSPNQYSISGSCSYYSDDIPIPDTEILLIGEYSYQAVSDIDGNYLIGDIFGGNYVGSALKTTDLGGLSGTDASRVARFTTGLYEFDCHQMIAADVTLNGSISATDASRIARYAAELIDDMNSGQNWVFLSEPVLNCDDWPPIIYEHQHLYNPLSADLEEEDFIGIRLGDVTGNWSPDQRDDIPDLIQPAREEPAASLPVLEAEIESQFQVPLTSVNLEDMEGMDIIIEYDPDVIDATGASLSGGILENENYVLQVNSSTPGVLILVLYANQDLFSGEGIILNIEFEATGFTGNISPLSFTMFEVNETSYLENTTDGSVTLVDTSQEGNNAPKVLILEQNVPNPFNPETRFSFYLPQSRYVKFSIFNLKGEKIAVLLDEPISAGNHELIWDADDLDSGIYFYSLETSDRKLIRKAVLMK